MPIKKNSKIQRIKDPKKTQTKKTSITAKKSSLTVDVLDVKGKKKGTVTLPEELFGVAVNNALIAQAVRVYLINQRQGGAKTLTRGEVSGSGRKIWRQKGTGRARHGDRYAGIFVGGGKAHGPKPRTFEKSLSRKMKRKALGMALSEQLKENRVVIVDGIEKIEAKTKALVRTLENLTGAVKQGNVKEKLLLATPKKVDSLYRAGRNIENLTIRDAALLTAYEVLNNRRIIFSKDAINLLRDQKTEPGSRMKKSEV